ncbi:MAG: hypothetical protein QME96_00985 [Myxococcota bacterium]|nr:hypothetical protein [Myxococcota bacterium]
MPDAFRIEGELLVGGELRRRRAGPQWTALRALLHVSLLFLPWLALRTLARFFLGLHRRVTVRLDRSGPTARIERLFVGRTIGEREAVFPWSSVLAVGRVKRHRSAHLLVGILCLVVGGSVGVVAIHDGIAGGYAPLALAGFGLLGLGVAIDMGLNIFVPSARRRSIVELRLPREDLWISGVDDDLAAAFIAAARERLATGDGARPGTDDGPRQPGNPG